MNAQMELLLICIHKVCIFNRQIAFSNKKTSIRWDIFGPVMTKKGPSFEHLQIHFWYRIHKHLIQIVQK